LVYSHYQPRGEGYQFCGEMLARSSSEVVGDNTPSGPLSPEEQQYKTKYRNLKKEFMSAVQTHEYVKSELRRHQKKLNALQEDKFFLFERLLGHEKPPPSPESNHGTDEEADTPGKKCKLNNGVTIASAFSKVKSMSGRKRKTKTKYSDEALGCLGRFEDEGESVGLTQQEDSD